jgi:hypothetical protein
MIRKDVVRRLIEMLEDYCDCLGEDNRKDVLAEASQMLNFWRMYENFLPAEEQTYE